MHGHACNRRLWPNELSFTSGWSGSGAVDDGMNAASVPLVRSPPARVLLLAVASGWLSAMAVSSAMACAVVDIARERIRPGVAPEAWS